MNQYHIICHCVSSHVQICTGGPAPAGSEDPDCSDGNFLNISIEAHLMYLGIDISRSVNTNSVPPEVTVTETM